MPPLAVIPSETGTYPIRPGNAVKPLIDGEPAFRRLCEAIEAAQHSVWATVTFMWSAFQMPDGRGSALDVLSRAAARGLDVRLIFWRPDPETESLKTNAFWGSPEHFAVLQSYTGRDRQDTIRIRWDRAKPGYCQHQKMWLIDAATEGHTAFLGGINLNPNSVVAPGHRGQGQNHDVYIELTGPATVDIHHNFVQLWNEASERHVTEGRWGSGSETDLPFPTRVPAHRGSSTVQIQRTMPDGKYRDDHATPGGTAFDLAGGERSNLSQYRAAIAAARRSIYLEHQHVDVPEIMDCLREALRQGVEIVLVLPAAGKIPEPLAALRAFETFTLAGLAGLDHNGHRKPVWIHSKLMIVDGEWATVGSCNLHRASLFGNAELNAAFWDQDVARGLLFELLREHLDTEVCGMDDLAALKLFRRIARTNSELRESAASSWRGIAFTLPA